MLSRLLRWLGIPARVVSRTQYCYLVNPTNSMRQRALFDGWVEYGSELRGEDLILYLKRTT